MEFLALLRLLTAQSVSPKRNYVKCVSGVIMTYNVA